MRNDGSKLESAGRWCTARTGARPGFVESRSWQRGERGAGREWTLVEGSSAELSTNGRGGQGLATVQSLYICVRNGVLA